MKHQLAFITFCLLTAATLPASPPSAIPSAGLKAAQVVIHVEQGKVILNWTRLHGDWRYMVEASSSSEMNGAEILAVVTDTFFVDLIASNASDMVRFYRIIANRTSSLDEYVVIESFEEPVELASYSAEQDLNPDSWQLVVDGIDSPETHSLELMGNTWKRQAIEPKQCAENEVWQLAAKSLSDANIQGFGIADSANELWYQLWGDTVINSESWNSAYTGWYAQDEWFLMDLPVAEDWQGRFGYVPRVLELLYANDNDDISEPGVFRIDEIRDLTPDIREPQAITILWQIEATPTPDSVDVAFALSGVDPENIPVEYFWTLGDESYSRMPSLIHRYLTDEAYKVTLRFREPDGLVGWATAEVVCGSGASSRRFSMITGGDVMIARRYNSDGVIDSVGIDGIFDSVRAVIQGSDLAMCNLECPFTSATEDHPTKEFTFKGDPEHIVAVPNVGFDYVALANNHNMDYLVQGMVDTQHLLDSLGVLSSGSAMNDLDAREPAVFSVNGLSAAILSFCNRDGVEANEQPFLYATRSRPGFAHWNRTQIEQAIPRASEIADLVIVQSHSGTEYAQEESSLDETNVHWNPEYNTFELIPDTADIDLRRYALDMGADIVINHHPHVIQGIETYNGKYIAHSMGNFAFDQQLPETFYTMALRAECSLAEGITDLEVLPLYIQDYIPRSAHGYLAGRILDYISELSRPMSTTLAREPGEFTAHIVSNSYNPRIISRDTTVSLSVRDTVWISEPVWIADGGYPALVSVPDSVAGLEIRVGRAAFWMGNFEEEGADPWMFNSEYERYDSTDTHSGRRCGLIAQPAGSFIEQGTLMTYRIPMDTSKIYTAQGWISTVNANDAALSLRYYDQRSQSVALSSQQISGAIDGTTPWTPYWAELTPHENTRFYNIWFSTVGRLTSAVEARFDDIEIVQWDEWQPMSVEIPFPSNVTHMQVRSAVAADSVQISYRVKWIPVDDTFPNGG